MGRIRNEGIVEFWSRQLMRLVSSSCMMMSGLLGLPMDWSPDGQWLAYTTTSHAPGHETVRAIFDLGTSGASSNVAGAPNDNAEKKYVSPTNFRLWATHRESRSSVLVTESAWPLTAPSWNPQGRSLVFGRFVPHLDDRSAVAVHGRIEAVIQDGLDRQRVIVVVPDHELGTMSRAGFGQAGPVWSPDGRFIAFAKPGAEAGILVIRVESQKVIATFEHASVPAWAKDSSKLAFIRNDGVKNELCVVERHGQEFSHPHGVMDSGPMLTRLCWWNDHRSILVVMEKPTLRGPEYGLYRCFIDNDEPRRVFVLTPEPTPARRPFTVRGVTLAYDADADRCFFSVAYAGRDNDLACNHLLTGEMKRSSPLDQSLTISSIAVSADSRFLALRFGSVAESSAPAIYDPAVDRFSPLVPDAASRSGWMELLRSKARSLLVAALPSPRIDGIEVERPTILPLPGELSTPGSDGVRIRLARLGRIGAAVYRDGVGGEAREQHVGSDPETELLFDYLRGEYSGARGAVDRLDTDGLTAKERLALLSVRAQMLWAQGNSSGARAAVDYLREQVGTRSAVLEETPLGATLREQPTPSQAWVHYLADKFNESSLPRNTGAKESSDDGAENPPANPFLPPRNLPGEIGLPGAGFFRLDQGGRIGEQNGPAPFDPAMRLIMPEMPIGGGDGRRGRIENDPPVQPRFFRGERLARPLE